MDPKSYREETLSKIRNAKSHTSAGPTDSRPGVDDVVSLIALAENGALPVKERLDAIEHINRIAFDLQAFKDHNPRYDRVLKKLRSDPSSMVRRAAFERLAMAMDFETLNMLQASLSGDGPSLVPNRLAATLLGLDDHASSREVLREVARGGDESIRQVALRGLAADANSAELLETIAADRQEHPETRQVATLSLKFASPERFSKLAQKLAVDEDEDVQVRATAVSSLAHNAEALEDASSDEFLSELDRVSGATKSRALKTSIKRLKTRAK